MRALGRPAFFFSFPRAKLESDSFRTPEGRLRGTAGAVGDPQQRHNIPVESTSRDRRYSLNKGDLVMLSVPSNFTGIVQGAAAQIDPAVVETPPPHVT